MILRDIPRVEVEAAIRQPGRHEAQRGLLLINLVYSRCRMHNQASHARSPVGISCAEGNWREPQQRRGH